MKELYKLTATEAISYAVDNVAEEHGISKKFARDLVLNALVYNCVIAEIAGQVNFLLEYEEDDDNVQ